jgi:hypothetical protein
LFSDAACPAKHANKQHPVTLVSRPLVRKAPALSLSKTQNDAKVTSKISSSRRIISWLTPALRVIVSSAGAVAARDASLANVSDNPAAPKAGIVLLRRFLFDARFTALPAFKPRTSVCLAIVRVCSSSRNVLALRHMEAIEALRPHQQLRKHGDAYRSVAHSAVGGASPSSHR